MTTFDDRERAFESMYARDQELQFKVTARRNRLLGAWAAELMGLSDVEADAYAKDVVRADFEEAGELGVFIDERLLGIVMGDKLYLHTDKSNLDDYVARGMQQFKPIFMGAEKPTHTRVTTVQK